MLEAVFLDLKYFIAFYSIVVFIYSVIFTVLLTSTTGGLMTMEEYDGIGLTGFLIMSFRTSLGDF